MPKIKTRENQSEVSIPLRAPRYTRDSAPRSQKIMNLLEATLSDIQNRRILNQQCFEGKDLDSILDSRDDGETIFLSTAFPHRKATEDYLKQKGISDE